MVDLQARMDYPSMNKLLVQRFYDEFLNTGDMDHAGELVSYDIVQHSWMDIPDGLEGLQAFMASFIAAFPDLRLDIRDMVAEGEKVVVRACLTGTNTGEFRGHAPTGRKISIMVIDIYSLADGKIMEHWDAVDLIGLYKQLGLDIMG